MDDENVRELLRLKDNKIAQLERGIVELQRQIDELEELLAPIKIDGGEHSP